MTSWCASLSRTPVSEVAFGVPTGSTGGTGPGGDDDMLRAHAQPSDPRSTVVWQLTRQSMSCAAMGSPLSAFLLSRAAADVLEDGPCAELLLRDVRPGRGDAMALRFLAALHRMVLDRQAPLLALHYPSVGGTPSLRQVGDVMVHTVEHGGDRLAELLAQPCQTNEVGRAAGLIVGLLDVAAVTGLPLSLREVGASAGLNLRLDRFAYEVPTGEGDEVRVLGPPDAELRFTGQYRAPLPGNPTALPVIADRLGCDLHPIDPTTPEGRARVSSAVWPDQTDRFERLGAALRTAARVAATVEHASAAEWIERQLAARATGVTTVVLHSVVREYMPAAERARFQEALEVAGAAATADAPVAHVQLEPVSALRSAGITVRIWPHAPEPRVLATCGAHGTDIRPRAESS